MVYRYQATTTTQIAGLSCFTMFNSFYTNFQDLRSLQLCLPHIRASQQRLLRQRQGLWINADVLPGPNRRHERCPVPAEELVKAVKEWIPGVPVSSLICKNGMKKNAILLTKWENKRHQIALFCILSRTNGSQSSNWNLFIILSGSDIVWRIWM